MSVSRICSFESATVCRFGGWPTSQSAQKAGCPRSGFSDLGNHKLSPRRLQIITHLRRTIENVVRKSPQPEIPLMVEAIQLSTAGSLEAAFCPSLKIPPSPTQPCPGSPKPRPGREPRLTQLTPPLSHFFRNPLKRKGLGRKNPYRPVETKNLPPWPPAHRCLERHIHRLGHPQHRQLDPSSASMPCESLLPCPGSPASPDNQQSAASTAGAAAQGHGRPATGRTRPPRSTPRESAGSLPYPETRATRIR